MATTSLRDLSARFSLRVSSTLSILSLLIFCLSIYLSRRCHPLLLSPPQLAGSAKGKEKKELDRLMKEAKTTMLDAAKGLQTALEVGRRGGRVGGREGGSE